MNLGLRPESILKTKLYRPVLPADAIERSALLHHLNEIKAVGFALVSAPAGFGKSTLLSAWLQQCQLPSAWLSLDSGDDDIAVFLAYCIAAIQEISAGACLETQALCKVAPTVSPAELTISFINELDSLSQDFVFVLDDYHFIKNQAIHELIARLILHRPRGLYIVVSARQDPPLPLERLRAHGKMLELRSPDLRFDHEEVVTLLEHSLRSPLQEETLTILDQYLEGWPVGVRLAALSITHVRHAQDLVAALSQWRGHAVDFLFSEVLSVVDAHLQGSLLRLSIVERFCPELYSVLCLPDEQSTAPLPDGQQFITWLQKANLFVVPLDDSGRWFRFHAVFLELLRRRGQTQVSDADRIRLHRRASQWFASAGLLDEALDHAVLANDYDSAATFISEACYTVINNEDWSRLHRWMSLLSSQQIQQSPRLLLCRAWLLHYEFRLAQLYSLLDDISATLNIRRATIPESEQIVLESEAAVLRSAISCLSARGEQAVQLALEALVNAPVNYTFLRGTAYLYYCLSMQMIGKGAEGIDRLHGALESEVRGNGTLITRILDGVAISYWMSANLVNVLRTGHQLLKLAEHEHLMSSRSLACMLLSFAYYQRNELDAAIKFGSTLVDHPVGAHPMPLGHVYMVMALAHQARGCRADALASIEKAYTLALQSGIALLLDQVESCQARLRFNGETAAAAMWADSVSDLQFQVMPMFLEMPALTLARVRLQQHTTESLGQAAEALAVARRLIERTHDTLHEVELLAIESLVSAATGHKSRAYMQLTHALKLAEPSGILRFFLDMGPEMEDLLHDLARHHNAPAYVTRVLGAFPQPEMHTGQETTASHTGARLIEPLTDRELEVLALLCEKLSNKEIAQLLVVSPQTVKTHLHHIFEKLQVSHRRDAVARAKTLGLLRA